MRLRALRVAGMLVGLAVLASACSGSGSGSPTVVMMDGSNEPEGGWVFAAGDSLVLEFSQPCQAGGAPLVALFREVPNIGPSNGETARIRAGQTLEIRQTLSGSDDRELSSIPFSLPDSLIGDSYQLHATCGVSDYLVSLGETLEVTVEPVDGALGGESSGPMTAELVRDRVIRVTGTVAKVFHEGEDPDVFSAVQLGDDRGRVFYYEIRLGLDIPRVSRVDVVLPDEIPPGEYLMTPGPDGEDNPVMITLGEP